jgi:chemotaxis protein CheX
LLLLNESTNDVLASTIASVKEVLQIPCSIGEPGLYNEKALHSEMCVLVGFTGDIKGRLIIDGDAQIFGKLGEAMFGMALEGDMLHSFLGEIANMLAGNTCTVIAQKGRKVDITPPTVLMGEMKLFGVENGFSFPIAIQDIGALKIILFVQDEKAG